LRFKIIVIAKFQVSVSSIVFQLFSKIEFSCIDRDIARKYARCETNGFVELAQISAVQFAGTSEMLKLVV